MLIQNYVVQQKSVGVDQITDYSLQLWHNGDVVMLEGPVSISVTLFHRMTESEPFTYEPTKHIVLSSGQPQIFSLEEGSIDYPGDWNMEIVIQPIDTTPPTVIIFSPPSDTTRVFVNSNIVLFFSEPVQMGTGTIAIHSGSAIGPVIASYDAPTSSNLTVSGNTLTINPSDDLVEGTHYFVTVDPGSINDIAGNSYSGTTSYNFTTTTTILSGTAGNDTFYAVASNQTYDGRGGIDTVVFNGKEDNYSIALAVSGFSVKDNVGTDGTDTVVNIEKLQFTDHTLTIAVAPTETLLESYRIYKAAFDRAPDYGGLGYWFKVMDHGATLTDIAGGFIGSNEFKAMYGDNPTDSTFVSLLYHHVLGRDLDQGGYDFWMNDLIVESRAQVLAHFSESTENIANVAGVIANGIIYEQYVG